MSSQQWELRFAVVKATHVYPRFCVVASFTAECSAVRATTRHPIAEFSMVRVSVAGRATSIFKMKGHYLFGCMRSSRFVAVVARNCNVGAAQRELGFSMLGNRKQRTVEILDRVAAFAPIIVRRSGKLAGMDVFVAVHAICKLHFVNSGLAGRQMTFRALHLVVFALQRIARGRVFFHAKQGGFPTLHRMALRAFSLGRAARELAFVNIFVTVSAIRKRERFLEIPIDVASGATHIRVLPS
jgi:hypothetical protein